MKKIKINGVKLGKFGLRFNGVYTPCWYSVDTLICGRRCVSIRSRCISKKIPAELGNVENNTDTMTDYFERDRVKFFEGSEEFALLEPLVTKRLTLEV